MTATLAPDRKVAHFTIAAPAKATFGGHPIEMQEDGSAIIRGVEIFKAGTFRDSWGDQQTWTDAHLQQMVFHFGMLRDADVFPDPPVRADHSLSIDKVIGYVEGLRVEGDKLVADYRVTEPGSIDKLARGTYRHVSSEVGMYVTNAEEAYFPVLYGFAYVDIPAVEGLHSRNRENAAHFTQEQSMPDPVTPTPTPPPTPAPAPAPAPAPTPAPEPAPAPTLHNFRVGGADVSDFAAVQRHIDALEGVVKQTADDNRKAFVTSLVEKKIILATQAEKMTELALGMADEQFASFCAAYEGAEPLALLGNHGAGGAGEPAGPNVGPPAGADEIAICEEQIAMFKRQGKTDEQITNTKAYKRLQELKS